MTVEDPVAMSLDQNESHEVQDSSAMDQSKDVPAGLILPPPEIQRIVEKVAVYVAKAGEQFENRIREKERANPRFAFLNPADPYHSYYQYTLQQARDGTLEETVPASAADMTAQKVQVEPVAPVKPPPEKPTAFEFMLALPGISAQDLDIMKLTAQFAAKNGKTFINALAQRESRNYQFEFLKTSHHLNTLFLKLVDHYRNIGLAPQNISKKITESSLDKQTVFQRVVKRVDYESYRIEQEEEARKKADEEKIAFATIDWHDFVIVDTIEFVEADESSNLPIPLSIVALQSMTLEQRKMMLSFDQQPGGPDSTQDQDQTSQRRDEDDEMHPIDGAAPHVTKMDSLGPTKIRTDYVPKLGKSVKNEPTQICAICGSTVKVSEMAEHVRIELLDPKWREQRAAYEAKHRDTNLLEGADIAKNLSTLSSFRTDIFGAEGDVSGIKRLEEDAEKAKTASKEKVIWDGHQASIASAAHKLHQQNLENAHLLRQQAAEEAAAEQAAINAIGPKIPTGPPVPPGGVPPHMQAYPPAPPPGYPMMAPAPPMQPYGAAPPGYPPQGFPGGMPMPPAGYGMYPPPPPTNMGMMPPPGFPPVPPPGFAHPPPPPMPGYGMPPVPPPMAQPYPYGQPDLHHQQQYQQQPQQQQQQQPVGPPEAKRPRLELPPIGEKTHPLIHVTLPTGETLTVHMDLQSTVSSLKDLLASPTSLASSKQKLIAPDGSVMKNSLSLTSYGVVPGTTLSLTTKDRGKKN